MMLQISLYHPLAFSQSPSNFGAVRTTFSSFGGRGTGASSKSGESGGGLGGGPPPGPLGVEDEGGDGGWGGGVGDGKGGNLHSGMDSSFLGGSSKIGGFLSNGGPGLGSLLWAFTHAWVVSTSSCHCRDASASSSSSF